MNELIESYENKIVNVELTSQNINQIIGALECAINELNKVDKPVNQIKAAELKTLLNYLESI